MSLSNEFKQLVALYRLLNRPVLTGSKFSGVFQCSSEETVLLLKALWQYKKFDLIIDFNNETYEIESNDDFPPITINSPVNITVSLPQNEQGKFYGSLEQWVVKSESLTRGSLTSNTYLLKEDVLVSDTGESAELNNILAICQLINKLGKIAHYHDEKASSTFRLVFVVPSKEDKAFYPVVLEIRLSTEMLEYRPDVSIIDSIIEEQSNNRLHALERVATFRIALAEIIKKSPNDKEAFNYLVCHWDDVLDNFQKSWESYINGFL